MKNSHGIFWGTLLVGAGLLALAQSLGYVDQSAPRVWIVVFAAIALLALVMYALSEWKQWGWLFPVGVFGGLAVTLTIFVAGIDKPFAATPLFVGLVIPFAAAFLMDRSRNWWALIPGGIMLFVALATLLTDLTGAEWIGTLCLLMIALGFLAAYLTKRSRMWALLVAYIFAVLSVAPLTSVAGPNADYIAPILLLGTALPFFVVYFRSSAHWWAIIPAGVMTTVTIIATLAIAGLVQSQNEGGYVDALMMVGLAATFAIVGWRNGKAWARIATFVLAVLATASLLFVHQSQVAGALAIIAVGGYLLMSALRPRTV